MKFTYEDKVEMYRLWKEEHYSLGTIAKQFKCNQSTIEYIVKLIDFHGLSVVRKKKNNKYSAELKESAIKRVLINHESLRQVSLSLAIPNKGALPIWIKLYLENRYNVIEKKRGRYGKKESTEDRIVRRIDEKDTRSSGTEHEVINRE